MSRVRFTKVSQPSSPPTSTAELYYDTTNSKLQAIDASGNVLRIGGFATLDYRLLRVVAFTSNQSPYTPSINVRALFVECIGGGGGGGGVPATTSQGTAAGGGGGGSYSAAWITTLAASYTITIGPLAAGGTAGANAGTTGNDTSFGSAVIGKGGTNGAAGTTAGTTIVKSAGGAGGVAGTGDITFVGTDGEDGFVSSGTLAQGGSSGAGPFGGGKKSSVAVAAGNTIPGVAATAYGAGGSGAANTVTQSAAAGGAGAQGWCRVWEFA